MVEPFERYSRDGARLIREVRIGSRGARTWIDGSRIPSDTTPDWDAWHLALRTGAKPVYEIPATSAFRVLDLFSGGGGLALGALDGWRGAGLRASICAALDLDREALEIYARNLGPEFVRHGHVQDAIDFQVLGNGPNARFAYAPEIVDRQLAARLNGLSAVIAGPPCQGHSNLNNHTRRDDSRNWLYLAVPAFAVATGAKVVVIENVPEVLRDRQGVVTSTITLLQEAGYSVACGTLDASDFGWPQRRRRFFLVALRDGRGNSEPLAKLTAWAERPARDLRWCIGDLEGLAGTVPFHTPAGISQENRRRIDWLFENDEYDLADPERPKCHQGGTSYGSVYGRLRWDEPTFTITTGFLTSGRGRYVHPSERRTLTPREAARIQGFPDWFDFRLADGRWPSSKAATKVIGDAVPSILGRLAALASVSLMESAALAEQPPPESVCAASVASEPARQSHVQ